MLDNALLAALAAVPVFYASVFVHELGHAVCGWAAGFRILSFGIGAGRPLWSTYWRGTHIYLSLHRSFLGLTFAIHPRLFPSRGQWSCLLAGGIAANLLTAVVAVALWRLLPWGWGLFAPAAALNALLALTSAVPAVARVGKVTVRSDGVALLCTWLRGAPGPEDETAVLRTCRDLRGPWGVRVDLAIRRTYLLRAATVWLSLGDDEYARQLLKAIRLYTFESAPGSLLDGTTVAGLTALAAGDPEGAAVAFEEAEHTEDRFLVRWLRGSFFLRRGEAARAAEVLDELAAHPLARRGAPLYAALLAARLTARCALSDEKGLHALLGEYEKIAAARRSALADLELYPVLAAFFRRRGDEDRAVTAYRTAVGAVRQLDERLTDPDERGRFRRCRAALVERAGAYFRQTGRAEEAAQLAEVFPDYEKRKRAAEERRRRTDARLLRAGILLLLVNVAAAAAGWPSSLAELSVPARTFFLFPAAFAAFGLVFLLAGWVWHRVHPATARGRGVGLVVLQLVPWLLWLFVAALSWHATE
jgi:tetratricopeptide (TPR) repeat protein